MSFNPSPEAGNGNPTSHEGLPFRQGEIVIGLTESPSGKRCVGMTYNGEEWLLLTSKRAPMVPAIRDTLRNHFNTHSMIGAAIDLTKSLEKSEIVLVDIDGTPATGIYVKPQDYDRLALELVTF